MAQAEDDVPEAEYVDERPNRELRDNVSAGGEFGRRNTEVHTEEFDAQPLESPAVERAPLRHTGDLSEASVQALMDLATGKRREESTPAERASGRPSQNAFKREGQELQRQAQQPRYGQSYGSVRPVSWLPLTEQERTRSASVGEKVGAELGKQAGKALAPIIDKQINPASIPPVTMLVKETVPRITKDIGERAGREIGPAVAEIYKNRENAEWNAGAALEALTHIDTWRGTAGPHTQLYLTLPLNR